VDLLRPAYRNRPPRPGQALLAPIRQLIESVIESVNDTLKGQLDLELHGGRTLAGVTARIAQRLLGSHRILMNYWPAAGLAGSTGRRRPVAGRARRGEVRGVPSSQRRRMDGRPLVDDED